MSVIRKASVFAAVLLGACAGSAHAQETVVAKIPFAFVVAGTTLPAGQYEVRPADSAGVVLEVVNLDDSSAYTLVMSTAAGGADPVGNEPVLVFTRDENKYLLTEIWDSNSEGRQVVGSERARHEAQAGGEHGAAVQQYVLAANWN